MTDNDERLMTLADLGKYLHIGQKTVLKLAVQHELPGVLIEKQWRFQRTAIDAWLEEQQGNDDDHIEDVPDGMQVPLGDLLPGEAIIEDLRATDSLGVIAELAARADTNRWLADKPWFIGALVERESLASTAMEGGVAFLHTRTRDKGKIDRPFIICGRSYQGIDFGAPDGRPTYLFFLLGLKYDVLHLPILGRLARVLRDGSTIATLRSLPSTQKIRGLLLKEDEKARTRGGATPRRYTQVEPKLDRAQRLRAIMRRDAIRKHEEEKAEATERKESAAAAKLKAAADKKAAAAEKRRLASEKKKAAAAAKKAAAAEKRRLASEKKKAAAAAKKAAAMDRRAAAATKKKAAAEKKKAAAAKKKIAAAKKREAAVAKTAASRKKAAAGKKAPAGKKKSSAAKKKPGGAVKRASAKKKA